jgi:hypothetical protein
MGSTARASKAYDNFFPIVLNKSMWRRAYPITRAPAALAAGILSFGINDKYQMSDIGHSTLKANSEPI